MFPPQIAARLPLQLTPEQRDAYVEVAHGVRDATIALYEAYLSRMSDTDAPAFDPREWKLLKQKEHLEFFASTRKQSPPAYPCLSDHQSVIYRSAEWLPQCALRCVGSFAGSLDDHMYGDVIPTEKAMMVRSLAISGQFVDHQSLCDLTVPTEDEPFTYVGLHWSARPPFLASMVRPRDYTCLQASGFCTIHHYGKQERVGFHVYHSMENIPGVPEFTEYGFRRCRIALCGIFRPADAGTIDLFATTAVDAGGDLPRQLTTRMAATSMLSLPRASENALQKKLMWLRSAQLERTPTLDATAFAPVCSQCTHKASLLSPLKRCDVCATSVCKRCLTSQTLIFGHTKGMLRRVNIPTCNGCLRAASKMDVRELAILEFVRPFEVGYVDSLRATDESISSDLSRLRNRSFFGTRNSAGFFSFRSASESESRRSSEQSSLWVPETRHRQSDSASSSMSATGTSF